MAASLASRSATSAPAASRAMSLKAGSLVRSSNSGLRATIFGAYGSVGRYVTSLLAGSGVQCVVPFRGDDMEWRHLKVMGDLGIVAPMPFSPNNIDTVRRAIEGSDIVVNLIGKDWETSHYLPWLINMSFEDSNVRIPEMIAKIAVEQVSCPRGGGALHGSVVEVSSSSYSRAGATGGGIGSGVKSQRQQRSKQ